MQCIQYKNTKAKVINATKHTIMRAFATDFPNFVESESDESLIAYALLKEKNSQELLMRCAYKWYTYTMPPCWIGVLINMTTRLQHNNDIHVNSRSVVALKNKSI